ncbi:MAG: hypothetical protein Q9217_002147 [Psora testacea]
MGIVSFGDRLIGGQKEPQALPTYTEALDQPTLPVQLRSLVPQQNLPSSALNEQPLWVGAEAKNIVSSVSLSQVQLLLKFSLTEVDTFNALIATPAIEYAWEMTVSDEKDFDLVRSEALKDSGSQSSRLFKNWASFRDAIAECCEAYPGSNYRHHHPKNVGMPSGEFIDFVEKTNNLIVACYGSGYFSGSDTNEALTLSTKTSWTVTGLARFSSGLRLAAKELGEATFAALHRSLVRRPPRTLGNGHLPGSVCRRLGANSPAGIAPKQSRRREEMSQDVEQRVAAYPLNQPGVLRIRTEVMEHQLTTTIRELNLREQASDSFGVTSRKVRAEPEAT